MLASGFYNMDCMDAMREFPDNFFDLAVVDPPYGDGGGTWSGKERFGERFDRYRHDSEGGVAREAYERVRVHRTGGTWAEKFGKKS